MKNLSNVYGWYLLLSLLSWLEYTYILPSFTENDKNGCELGQKPKIEARIRLSMPKTDLTTIFDHTDGLGSFFKLFGSNLQLSFLSSRGDDFRVMCFCLWSWLRTNSFYYCLGVSGLPKLLIFFILFTRYF